jgi:hypothetical protein
MNRLNGMMDKILDMQHPERVQERAKNNPPKRQSDRFSGRSSGENRSKAPRYNASDTALRIQNIRTVYGWDNQLNGNSNETHSIDE